MIIEYIRKGKYNLNKKNINGKKYKFVSSREKKGVLVALVDHINIVRIGWSLYNFFVGDKFTNKDLKIAKKRALLQSANRKTKIPFSIEQQFKNFTKQVITYYKDKKIEIFI